MVEQPISGVTQDLLAGQPEEQAQATVKFYCGRYFVCETISLGAAKAISEAMGWEFVGEVGPT
jgi:hypothetical protein